MNTKHPNSTTASSRHPVSFRIIFQDQPDYWTPLMSAFLVVCLLTALAMCSWQAGDWNKAQTVKAQPVVANQGFSVKAERTF